MEQTPRETAADAAAWERLRNDPETIKLAQKRLASVAQKAREDLPAFFSFVMRNNKTNQRVVSAPHQKVIFDFVMAHDRAVLILPPGHSKTACMVALSLWLTGRNPNTRGAIVSATHDQAKKVVRTVRDMVESSQELRLVFPDLAPSDRIGDPWREDAITVRRAAGVPDPTMRAYGMDGPIAGARLNWIVVDDLLDRANTKTREQRIKVKEWFDTLVLSRLDYRDARIVLCNTPWDQDDLLHSCEKVPPDGPGWATLRMDVEGNVRVQDDWSDQVAGKQWESPDLRPATPDPNEECYRLRAHDPDEDNCAPLWPEEFPRERIEEKKLEYVAAPSEYNKLYLLVCRDDATAMCKQEWVDLCKRNARERGVFSFVSGWKNRPEPTFTGVDLAFSQRDASDDTAFFTFAVLDSGHRQILEIDAGKFDSGTILKKIADKNRRYGSIVVVENNGAQQFVVSEARRQNVSVPVRGHRTDASRADPTFGVPLIFSEMYQGAWLLPNAPDGRMPKALERWVNACLYYEPTKHPDDTLMACVVPGTPVTTSRGLVSIEDVCQGDRVLTHKGRWRKVTGTTKRRHEGEVLRIKPRGGAAFSVTSEHPVWSSSARIETETRSNRVICAGDWEFRSAVEIAPGKLASGSLLQFTVPKEKHGEGIPSFNNKIVESHELDVAMLVGLYIAEGSVGGDRHVVNVALHEREEHLGEFFRAKMREHFDANCSPHRGSGKCVVWTAWSRDAYYTFQRFGSGAGKEMPWAWMDLSPEFREHVVRGWLMGDGCYISQRGRANLEGASISRGWLEQARITLWENGYLASMRAHEKGGPKHVFGKICQIQKSWKLKLTQTDSVRFLERATALEHEHWGSILSRPEWKSGRTNTPMFLYDGHVLAKVSRAERVAYEGDVHNLHVEEDESFCVEGIAVHNCFFAHQQARKWGMLVPGARKSQQQGPGVAAKIMAR